MWPKKPKYWQVDRTLKVSIPFTWNLPDVLNELKQRSLYYDNVVVGGPAVKLLPGFFAALEYVKEGDDEYGVLQRINPLATRTTVGCIRRCGFCAIGSGRIEPIYRELEDWPNLPVICDNNLLASSREHFDKVINRLVTIGIADFNQGLDSRLLNDHHAAMLSKIKKPIIRLALDHMDYRSEWEDAFLRLVSFGIAKKNISSYCLIGFQDNVREAWRRCQWVEEHGIKAYPMWFHGLRQLRKNIVTEDQKRIGWTDNDRKHIMGFYYKHRGTVPVF